jgi:hypothetical protein
MLKWPDVAQTPSTIRLSNNKGKNTNVREIFGKIIQENAGENSTKINEIKKSNFSRYESATTVPLLRRNKGRGQLPMSSSLSFSSSSLSLMILLSSFSRESCFCLCVGMGKSFGIFFSSFIFYRLRSFRHCLRSNSLSEDTNFDCSS